MEARGGGRWIRYCGSSLRFVSCLRRNDIKGNAGVTIVRGHGRGYFLAGLHLLFSWTPVIFFQVIRMSCSCTILYMSKRDIVSIKGSQSFSTEDVGWL